jgi:multicomponent Na+:H+ antiporter subunit D
MNLEAQLPALQIVVPLVVAPLVVLLRDAGLAWAAACVTSVMCLAVAVLQASGVLGGEVASYQMGGWPAPFGIELRVDAFSALILLVITGASTLSLLGGRASLAADIADSRQPLFYAAWLIALAGLSGIAVTGDAFNVFVFMEISSLATYILIAAGPDRRALTAVFKYLIMGTVGATFYLIGVGLVYMMTGTLNFADMEARIAEVADQRPILVAAGFITIGLALKAAVFPLHVWLPNAYTHAPNVVTAFVAACSTKVALYVLLRFDFFVFQGNLEDHLVQFAGFMIPLALLGIVVGSAVALVETDLKRMLAYSSVAQIGYILLGASFASGTGLMASISHMFNHALAKGALFLAVAAIGMRLSHLTLEGISGIARVMPWTMAGLAVAGASLVGIPGTAGFVSKWLLLQAAMEHGAIGFAAAAVVVVSSLAAVVYIWRIIERAWFGAPDTAESVVGIHEAPWPLLAVLWIAAAANIYFGLVPAVPLELAASSADELLRHLP